MNRTLATMFLTATISATLGVSSLQAQRRETADIPFAFQVQSQQMPAGKYEVKQLSMAADSVFSISDSKGHSRLLMAQLPGKANPQTPKLTFSCYAGACSLARISLPGSEISHGLKLHNSNVHMGMATEIAIRLSH